ncbi:MAG: DUF2252 family protein [bacterium]
MKLNLSKIIMFCFLVNFLDQANASKLKDVSYSFDSEKITAAPDSFHFLRSFVDFFYLVFKKNQNDFNLKNISDVQGWCVGDAHPENFGVLLLENQSPLFTMNDIDDSGPCPVALDLFRLMVSSRLYDEKIKLDDLKDAYVAGLKKEGFKVPKSILEMISKSQKRGIVPSDKKVSDNKIVRDSQMKELSDSEFAGIKRALNTYDHVLDPNFQILDVLATSKVGGGSGGLSRYEVLLKNGNSNLHLEFKEMVNPSVYPVSENIPSPDQRVKKSILFNQGLGASRLYKVVEMNAKSFFIRPRFAGNVGVTLEKQSTSDNKEIIQYEAFSLGLIHSRSISDLNRWIDKVDSLKKSEWENDVSDMSEFFKKKYKSLKN